MKTIRERINQFESIHGKKYDYSKVKSTRSVDKVPIICNKHGEFLQQIKVHLRGCGCPECGKEKLANKFKLSNDEFISKAVNIHGDLYNYDNVDYINGNTNVLIRCSKHGLFSQRPYDHLQGKGCNKCGRIKTVQNRKSHDFTKTRWVSLVDDKCYLYLYKFTNGKETFFKIGITKNLNKRYRKNLPYKIILIDYIESNNPDLIWDLESNWKKKSYLKYKPKNSFSGKNECYVFTNEILKLFKHDKTMCCD